MDSTRASFCITLLPEIISQFSGPFSLLPPDPSPVQPYLFPDVSSHIYFIQQYEANAAVRLQRGSEIISGV